MPPRFYSVNKAKDSGDLYLFRNAGLEDRFMMCGLSGAEAGGDRV